MRYLVDQGVLANDPIAALKKSRVPRRRRAPLGVHDLRQLLIATQYAHKPWIRARDRAIIFLLFYTGLRISELLALTLDQVDLGQSSLYAAKRKGAHVTDEYLPEPARRELASYLALRPKGTERALILASHGGKPSKRAIQKRLGRLGELAHLRQNVHPHALRHAHATVLDALGEAIMVIQDSLNHSKVQTNRGYIHVSDRRIRAARDRLPDLDTAQDDQDA